MNVAVHPVALPSPSVSPHVAKEVSPCLAGWLAGCLAAVVAEAVSFLARVCGGGLLRKRFLLMVAAKLHHFRLLQVHTHTHRVGTHCSFEGGCSASIPSAVILVSGPPACGSAGNSYTHTCARMRVVGTRDPPMW